MNREIEETCKTIAFIVVIFCFTLFADSCHRRDRRAECFNKTQKEECLKL